MAVHSKAMLHLFCLKQLQENSVPALTYLHFTMQAEQRGSATSEEAKNPSCSASRTEDLVEGIQQLPPAWESVAVPAAPSSSFSNVLSVLPQPGVPGWTLSPHQSQWARSWSWAGEPLLLPSPKASPGTLLSRQLLRNSCHSRPFLTCAVIQEAKGIEKTFCHIFSTQTLFVTYSSFFLSHLIFTLFYFCYFLIFPALFSATSSMAGLSHSLKSNNNNNFKIWS